MLFKIVFVVATVLAAGSGKAIFGDEPKPIRNDVSVSVPGPPNTEALNEIRSAATTSVVPTGADDAATTSAATMTPVTSLDVDMTGTARVVLPTMAANMTSSSGSSPTEASTLTTMDSKVTTTVATTLATTMASSTTEDPMSEPAGNRTTSVENPIKLTLTRDLTKDKAVVKDEVISPGEASNENSESDESSEATRMARQEDTLAEAAGGENKYPEMTLTRNINKGGAVIKDEVRNAGEGKDRKQRDLTLMENKMGDKSNKKAIGEAENSNQLRNAREDKKAGSTNNEDHSPHFQATRGFTNDMAMIKDEVNMGRKQRQAGGATAAAANAADMDNQRN